MKLSFAFLCLVSIKLCRQRSVERNGVRKCVVDLDLGLRFSKIGGFFGVMSDSYKNLP